MDVTVWARVADTLAPEIDEVDRRATGIWCAFVDMDEAAHVRTPEYINRSHRYLYGHRFWPQVKSAITALNTTATDWVERSVAVADAASRTARVDRERLLGIALVGLITRQHVGEDIFDATPARVMLTPDARLLTRTQVLHRRQRFTWRDHWNRFGRRRDWPVVLEDDDPAAVVHRSEGQTVIPACGDAACNGCWVGVLSGNGAELVQRACRTPVHGKMSIVAPPWNPAVSIALRATRRAPDQFDRESPSRGVRP